MVILKLIGVGVLIGFAASNPAPNALLHPCKTDDMKCLRDATQQFLESTSKGIPQFDILPIDPLLISEYKWKIEGKSGPEVKLTNIKITGLKNQDISEFRMNTKDKSVWLSLGSKLEIQSDMAMEFTNPAKIYNGHFIAKANVLGNSSYNYELQKDSNGTEHFIVGPETIVGQVSGKPEFSVTYSEESVKDPDFANHSKRYQEKREELRIQLIKKIVEKAYVSLIHNIRSAAKALPKEAFFVDV